MKETEGLLLNTQTPELDKIKIVCELHSQHPEIIQIKDSSWFNPDTLIAFAKQNPLCTFLIIVDEQVVSKSDARRSMAEEAIDWSHISDVRGHIRARIMFISPDYESFDKRFRKTCDLLVICKKIVRKFSTPRQLDAVGHKVMRQKLFVNEIHLMEMGVPSGKHITRAMQDFPARSYFPIYDTHSLKNFVRTNESAEPAKPKGQWDDSAVRDSMIMNLLESENLNLLMRDISKATGIPEHIVRQDLERLVKQGKITKDGNYFGIMVQRSLNRYPTLGKLSNKT